MELKILSEEWRIKRQFRPFSFICYMKTSSLSILGSSIKNEWTVVRAKKVTITLNYPKTSSNEKIAWILKLTNIIASASVIFAWLFTNLKLFWVDDDFLLNKKLKLLSRHRFSFKSIKLLQKYLGKYFFILISRILNIQIG